jgi:chemotaxis protein methyltransferase CheR
MYMSPHRAESILSMLGKCLSEEGLIALAPVEASLARNLPLRSGAYGHACLLRSRPVTASGHAPEHFSTPAASPVKLQPIVASTRTARSKRNKSLHPERENAGPDSEGTGERRGEEAAPSSLLRKAREFADHGRLEEALTSAVNAFEDSGEAEAGFLVATVLREMGQDEEAIRRLEDLVAAHQDFVLAHFTLGTLLQRNQKVDAALGHYYEALRLLEHREPDSILPGTSGEMTAGHMLRLVSSLLERKARR